MSDLEDLRYIEQLEEDNASLGAEVERLRANLNETEMLFAQRSAEWTAEVDRLKAQLAEQDARGLTLADEVECLRGVIQADRDVYTERLKAYRAESERLREEAWNVLAWWEPESLRGKDFSPSLTQAMEALRTALSQKEK